MKKTGIELIAAERQEQIHKHGRTIGHDVLQNKGRQLRIAAGNLISDNHFICECPPAWDHEIWDKMRRKTIKERLIIAGALIAAEIDRLQATED